MNAGRDQTPNCTGNGVMLRINCPFCGECDHSEFAYGGDGAVAYPALDANLEEWHSAVFCRDNIDGRQVETWHHVHGCRAWLLVERCTLTHEIFSVKLANGRMDDFIRFNPANPANLANNKSPADKLSDKPAAKPIAKGKPKDKKP